MSEICGTGSTCTFIKKVCRRKKVIMSSCRQWKTCTVAVMLGFLLVQILVLYPCFSKEVAGDTVAQTCNNQDCSRIKYERPLHRPDVIRDESMANVPPPQTLPQNSPIYHYKPTWESLESRPIPAWYEDAKIGIFIHWGVYSVPGFVEVGTKGLSEWFWYNWQGPFDHHHRPEAHTSTIKYVQENYAPNLKYTDFGPQFTAEFYDPEYWAELFEKSGAKYVVLTSKHHDGYTLWGSKRSWNWNAVDTGPHRDLLGDLTRAIRTKTDLHFGVYHSLYEWFHPMYLEDQKNDYKTQTFVKEKMTPEFKELINVYKPEVVWSDGHWDADCSYWNCTEMLAWLYNESPVRDLVVTNDRWGKGTSCKHGGFLSCDDRHNPLEKMHRKWENCMTIDKESWGYRKNARAEDYYNMDELTEILAQTISYGGNLLMNIGPTSDGRIPPIYEERLTELGKWLGVNGEAVYTSREWLYPRDSVNSNIYYTKAKDNSAVYAIILEWPEDDLLHLAHPQPTASTEVTWLGYADTLQWKESGTGGITITLPKISISKIPCRYAWVFKLVNLKNIKHE